MTFDAIYASNAWNGVESRSGPGSGLAPTRRVADALRWIVSAFRIKSVLNVACGDDLWTPDLPGYLGVDVSTQAIARARVNHPERAYEVRDARDLGSIHFDLVICRDVLQHIPADDAQVILRELDRASTYRLISTYLGTPNVVIAEGGFYSPDLTAPPFSRPMADLLIFDGYDYGDGVNLRDPHKFLGLWR